eukprot:3093468-Pleurochrysis_carterae.AAC.1
MPRGTGRPALRPALCLRARCQAAGRRGTRGWRAAECGGRSGAQVHVQPLPASLGSKVRPRRLVPATRAASAAAGSGDEGGDAVGDTGAAVGSGDEGGDAG